MALFTATKNGSMADGDTFGNTSPGVAGVDFPSATDSCDLAGYELTQGTVTVLVALTDSIGGGQLTITDDFDADVVTDALLYCNATVGTINVDDWNYSGSGTALAVGTSGDITTLTGAMDITSTGSAITNAGTIGTCVVYMTVGRNDSSKYAIENTGDTTYIGGSISYGGGSGSASQGGIHNNGGTIGEIFTSIDLFMGVPIYNESGTISNISGTIKGESSHTIHNKGTITTISGPIFLFGQDLSAVHNDGGTIGDITGTVTVWSGTGIYNTNGGTIGDVSLVTGEPYNACKQGVYIDSGSIGDVKMRGEVSTYGLYNVGSTNIGYIDMVIVATTTNVIGIYNDNVSNITYTGVVGQNSPMKRGFDTSGGTGIVVDVDFNVDAEASVYWIYGTGEFTGTVGYTGYGHYGVYVGGGTLTYSGDMPVSIMSGGYGLYIEASASGTFNGSVSNYEGIAVYNASSNTVNTNITNAYSGVGYQHSYAGGIYSGTLTNTCSGDGIQIYGSGNYLDEISGIVTSTSGYPVDVENDAYGVKKISGTVSYTPALTTLVMANIKKDVAILGVTGTLKAGGQHSSAGAG
jgi:hypothetical protein